APPILKTRITRSRRYGRPCPTPFLIPDRFTRRPYHTNRRSTLSPPRNSLLPTADRCPATFSAAISFRRHNPSSLRRKTHLPESSRRQKRPISKHLIFRMNRLRLIAM